MFHCTVDIDENIDEDLAKYFCRVDLCLRNSFEYDLYDPFDIFWRKLPYTLNLCGTNAQMSLVKIEMKNELTIYKVNNMLERKNRKEKCDGMIVNIGKNKEELNIGNCAMNYYDYSTHETLAGILQSHNKNLDFLVIYQADSLSSSYILFQHIISNFDNICQINFVYSLPKYSEENGFRESLQKLRKDSKFLLLAGSKDRLNMHLNLFFVNMKNRYCRERYLRYFTYF
ncbi:unnamed protein product [Caenorhabditis angaria]|uniref:Uncharacterized protein n=1 Tax=Caenorhabditis angaria TaxID=860376 RepID=A0A9P1N8X5_9PELO|nr:unnamed protein product [Caenorhabditis angaria]